MKMKLTMSNKICKDLRNVINISNQKYNIGQGRVGVYTCKNQSKVVEITSTIFAYVVQIPIICLPQNSEMNFISFHSTL